MTTTIAHQEAEILERAFDAAGSGWSREIAAAILSTTLSPQDVERMNELAAKSQAGTLEADEEIEIESYRLAARLLEVLKLRARAAIKRAESSKTPP